MLLDGAAGRQSGTDARPRTSSGALAKSNNLEITIRASSPDIAPYEQKQVKITSQSMQVDISAKRSICFLRRDKIVVSEPGASGKVYVSGLAGAVTYPVTPITRMKIVTATNLRTWEKSSGQVNSVGGFAPIAVRAIIGDLLRISFKSERRKSGAPLIFEVIDNVPPHVVGTKPTDGDKDIIVDEVIIVWFSEPIDTNTVNFDKF